MNQAILPLPDQLRTRRLIARAPRPADAAPIFDGYTQDLDVARYMVWRPHQSLGETETFISYCIEGWASGRSRAYVLARHGSEDQPIGMLEARLHPHMLDVGYVLARAHWGEGLMPEALEALCAAALALPACYRVQATCDVDNLASAKALGKAGFIHEARLERYALVPNISPEPRPCFMYARCR